jgi:hypothetical protein
MINVIVSVLGLKKEGRKHLEMAYLQLFFTAQLAFLHIALLKLPGVLNFFSAMRHKKWSIMLQEGEKLKYTIREKY